MIMAQSTIRNLPSIVEQGTSGIWTYRKWSDGTAECWGRFDFTTGTFTTWGTAWYINANVFKQAYPPSLFIAAPVENINCADGISIIPIFDGLPNDYATKDATAGYKFARANTASSTTIRVSVHSIGKWK